MVKTYALQKEQVDKAMEFLADLYVQYMKDAAMYDAERYDDSGNWDSDTSRMQNALDKAGKLVECADLFGGFSKEVHDRVHTASYGW